MVQRPAQILKLALQVVEMHQKAGFRIRLAREREPQVGILEVATRRIQSLLIRQAVDHLRSSRKREVRRGLVGRRVFIQRAAKAVCRFARNDEALAWLERSVQFGMSRAQIEARPECSHIADDARYQALLALVDENEVY